MDVREINGTLCMSEELFEERFKEMELNFDGYVTSFLFEAPSTELNHTPPSHKGMASSAEAHILPTGDSSHPRIEVTVDPSEEGIHVQFDDGLGTFEERTNTPGDVQETINELAAEAQEYYLKHQAALDRVNSFLDQTTQEDHSEFEDMEKPLLSSWDKLFDDADQE